MSFPLPSVDLTSATVGTTGIISLQNTGISAGGVSANPSLIDKPATLFMFNDSGCGLSIIFSQTGGGVNLPAGGWVPVPLPPGENKITWTVLYVLPSPPVSLLLLTYYPSGEDIPQSMTLGNSPVGIGGNVTTSSVQTLSNEGSASNLLVVDMGDTGHASIVTLYNDGHMLWSVDQSGTLHQIIKAQTAGTPLQLGQASDITEVLGSLLVDKFLSIITATNDGQISGQTSGTVTLYQPLRGDIKLMYFKLENYKNTGTQSMTPPVPFTGKQIALVGDTGSGHVDVKLSGVGVNADTITTLAAGGGTVSGQSFFGGFGIVQIGIATGEGAWNTIDFQLNTSAANGVIIIIGQ